MKNQKIDEVSESFLKIFPVVIQYIIHLGDTLSDPKYSYQEYQTLHVLKKFGKLPISKVGDMLLISKPRMTLLVDKLTVAGLIERIPDKKDRRIIKIALTEKGIAFNAAHSQNLKEGVIERFHKLNEDEMDEFLAAMKIIQDIMSKTKFKEDIW